MHVDIHAQDVELTTAHRDQIQRRCSFALSRMKPRLRHVSVHLADVNGPRGGVDLRCRVTVVLDVGEPVFIEDQDHDMVALINRSFARAGHAVEKRVKRSHQLIRPRQHQAFI